MSEIATTEFKILEIRQMIERSWLDSLEWVVREIQFVKIRRVVEETIVQVTNTTAVEI